MYACILADTVLLSSLKLPPKLDSPTRTTSKLPCQLIFFRMLVLRLPHHLQITRTKHFADSITLNLPDCSCHSPCLQNLTRTQSKSCILACIHLLLSRDFSNDVIDGTIDIPADEFPSFLYAADTIYDPNDCETGLFRNPIVLRVSL
jgi:hypothetical protein